MSESAPRSGTPAGAVGSPGSGGSPDGHGHQWSGTSTASDVVPIVLDPRLAGRLFDLANGRVLVIDYLLTRPSWSLPMAELSVRLQRASPRGTVRIATIEGVPCVADPRLTPVLQEAGIRIRPIAGAILGQFEVDLERPLVWLDFLSSTAARRP